jgi:hypothetical protein
MRLVSPLLPLKFSTAPRALSGSGTLSAGFRLLFVGDRLTNSSPVLLHRSETYSSSVLNELGDRIVPGVQVAYRSRQRIAVLDGTRGSSAADTVLQLQATQQ